MRRKLLIGVGVVCVVAAGGYKAAEIFAEKKVRQRIDTQVAAMGLTGQVAYGKVDVDLIGSGAAVSDFVFSEQGEPVWRIDRLAVTEYAEDKTGNPTRFAGEMTGAHLAFAEWAKLCKEKHVACAYEGDAEALAAHGTAEMLVDASVDYRIDDPAKEITFSSALTLRDTIDFALKGKVIGLDNQAMAEAAAGAGRAIEANLPPAMALLVMGVQLGRTAEQVAISDFGFAMKDLGGVRKGAMRRAEETNDQRPVDAVLAEQLTEAKVQLHASAQPWMPEGFVDDMGKALDAFVWDHKPYRITMAQGKPVTLLTRGQAGLELPPEISNSRSLFDTLTPKVDNQPLDAAKR
jgi:hypothetical protein